ncbi:MAG: amino acid ABC transporter substrate-binding protein [Desulfosarcinaceae bacterium]|nr:amino acid ABC transporter substrate-binding protein [Desulfosarcinaceae bacterium]
MKLHLLRVCCLLCGLLIVGVPSTTADAPPIRIGATVSETGRYAEPSRMIREALQLWVDQTNRKGGLLARKIELILYDDKSDPTLARTQYIRLIETDGVELVFSPYSTPLTLAVSEVTEANQKVMLAIAAAAETPWRRGARYLFQLYAPANRQFIGLLDMMAKKHLRTLSVLFDETSTFNLDTVDGVKTWAQLYKIDIGLIKGFRDGVKELPDLLAMVAERNAQGLVLSAYPPDAYELLRLMDEARFRPTVLAMPIVPAHPDFQKKVGPIADRVFAPSQWEPDERIPFPGTRQFIDAFTAFTGHLPSFHAASAYAGCQLLQGAVQRTGTLDHEKLRDYIAALDTVTVLGRFKVDPAGLQVGHNSFIIQWQQGKKEIVWPQKMQTARPLF